MRTGTIRQYNELSVNANLNYTHCDIKQMDKWKLKANTPELLDHITDGQYITC